MPRTFYTERDIEDLAHRGAREIEVNDDVYITDVAREKMEALGIRARPVGSSAATGRSVPSSAPSGAAVPAPLSEAEKQQVIEKVKSGVIARLGPGVDAVLLDNIVRRVVGQL